MLAALEDKDFERLAGRLEWCRLERRQMLVDANEPIEHVYFPLGGLTSLIMGTMNGFTVEVAMVGNEGAVGLPVAFGSDSIPISSLVQVPGEAYRMSAAALRDETRRSRALVDPFGLFGHALLVQVAQSVVCISHHAVVQRCARWLLMTRDRVGTEEFTLTQDYLAQMLGVRRASVSVAASHLQEAGLIRYRRGHIVIVDGRGLEERSCECYRIIKAEYERLLR